MTTEEMNGVAGSASPAQLPIGTNLGQIVPVAALHSDKGLNRKSRRQDYYFHGEMDFPEESEESKSVTSIPVYSYQKDGSLVFLMPDGSSYRIEVSVVCAQLYNHWKISKESAAAQQKTSALPGAEVSKPES